MLSDPASFNRWAHGALIYPRLYDIVDEGFIDADFLAGQTFAVDLLYNIYLLDVQGVDPFSYPSPSYFFVYVKTLQNLSTFPDLSFFPYCSSV